MDHVVTTIEPGCALDSLIAERVMGYIPRQDLSKRPASEAVWYTSDGALLGNNPPPYSTHFAAAQDLARRLLSSVSLTLTQPAPTGPWRCELRRLETPVVVEGRTMPHALALAALAVAGLLGAQVEQHEYMGAA